MSLLAPLHVTFGVEIECVVKLPEVESKAFLKKLSKKSILELHDLLYTDIKKLLELADIPADDEYEVCPDYSKWTLMADTTIHDREEIGEPNQPGYRYVIMEMISRVLPLNVESFQEIECVLDTIRSKYLLITNRSCGLHVHVGNRQDGFPLSTAKRFVKLILCFEHLLLPLHPEHRAKTKYAQTMNDSPALKDCPDLSSRLKSVDKCQDFFDLAGLVSPGKFSAYNLNYLCRDEEDPSDIKRTIEFRQHAGSIDAEAIVAWVKLTTGLVKYSHEISESQLLYFCVEMGQNINFSTLDFLEAVGQAELIDFYRQRMIAYALPTCGPSTQLAVEAPSS
ncbi:hypothetical protein MMC19_002328 [Ptychographa xylographoides]|nr:hypothetical protein [Ptychographa xylographoides]